MKLGKENINDSRKEHLQIRIQNNSEKQTGGCWIWQGAVSNSGYGRIKEGGKQYIASRLSFVVFNQDLKDGEIVRHICDNRLCVNPEHLISGTNSDNVQDAINRSRLKVNKSKIQEIKNRLYSYKIECIEDNEIFWGHVNKSKELGMDPRTFLDKLKNGTLIKGKKYRIIQKPALEKSSKGEKIDWDNSEKLKLKIEALSDLSQNGCWEFAGYMHNGYGAIRVGDKYELAHRVSYVLNFGEIPEGLVIRHTCHNKICVNPSHLKIGTQADNANDNVIAGNLISNPKKMSKIKAKNYGLKIQNTQTGEITFGLKTLANKIGVSPAPLRRKIRAKEPFRGILYRILKEGQIPLAKPPSGSGGQNSNAKAVLCVETKVEYETRSAAAKTLGLSVSAITNAIKRGNRCGGFTWRNIGKN